MSKTNNKEINSHTKKEFDEDQFDDALFEKNLSNSDHPAVSNSNVSLEDTDDFLDTNATENPKVPKKINKHLIFFAVVLILFLYAAIRLVIWNKGEESGYDPSEDTSEFDTEPLDHIQPLNHAQLEGKPDDGITTIFCLGNSPFSDHGKDNALARELGKAYQAEVVNASFADSLQSAIQPSYSDSEPRDGISLYAVANALVTGDFSTVDQAAAALSEEAVTQANYLKTVDLSKADLLFIMYDLSDYIEHRPVYDPGFTSNPITFAGALESTIQLIQEKYPYIRIVVLSTPASGKTIDGYYVDGDLHDLGNGTLVDYLGYEANICVSNGVSLIDTYFGVINIDNRDKYLTDDYHINEEGAKAIAARVYKLIGLS